MLWIENLYNAKYRYYKSEYNEKKAHPQILWRKRNWQKTTTTFEVVVGSKIFQFEVYKVKKEIFPR